MNIDEFRRAATELRSFAEYLYFHLMGEPLLHPLLADFLLIANELGFKVILTTNGTLLKEREKELLCAPALFKVSISLHSYEANESMGYIDSYLKECFEFCEKAANKGIISVMRLWNKGGNDYLNEEIISKMHTFFDKDPSTPWREIYSGYKIKEKIFLEWGEHFDWPDTEADYCGDDHYCYGLKDQIGVLSDGTVVPCCLDAEGAISLGNIFKESLDSILSSDRATKMKKAFEKRQVQEELCRRCSYAHKKKYR